MQKIYVLLRNDQQTGPYSLEEIVQFDLKPYDLIWIEGKSAGWYYPQEIGALRPYLGFLPKKPEAQTQAAKTVFVATPPTVKKEEPFAAPLPQPVTETPTMIATSFAPVSENFEREVYAQFQQKVDVKEPVFTPATTGGSVPKARQKAPVSAGVGIVTVLVVGGVFAASWIMNRHSNEEETKVAELTASAPVQEVPGSTPAVNIDGSATSTTAVVSKQKGVKTGSVNKETGTPVKQSTAPRITETVVGNRRSANDAEATEATTALPEETPAAAPDESATVPAETTAPQEKKKKLRDKILDIFRKKPDEQKTEEAQPAESTSGERRSTHRESGANLVQMVSIRFTVPNDWMIGVRGAKATLVNRSNQKIEKATVEVLYYNDDNELLQKKVITFGKVDGKDSKTIAIPDHGSATRVDYTIVSVVGEPAA